MPSEDLDSLNLLPYNFVKENKVFAEQNNDVITVYHANDFCPELFQEIRRFLQSPFSIKQCSQDEFDKLITSSFSASTVNNELPEELKDDFDLKSFAGSISATEDLLSGNDDAPIIKLINGIISQAIKARASDIHFEPYEDVLSVRFRIDGILKEVITQDFRLAPLIIARLKIISKLDISERRLPQDGRITLSLGEKSIDVRVSTLPSSYGERIVLRLLDKQSAQINIDDLGLPTYILKPYKKTLKDTEGIILVTGPTGSGKTTTLYAGLRYLSDSSQNLSLIHI